MATSKLLKKLGFEVVVAKNGEEALKAFASAQNEGASFSALILDLSIRSGWGGIRTLKEIRKLDTEVPAIVASGYSNDPVMATPERFGFAFSIRKPFNMVQLKELAGKLKSEIL